MGTAAVSGSASGIGAAIRARMESDGDTVIGIDLVDAEVTADLSTLEGRETAMSQTMELCDGRLDRLVACAGIGPHIEKPALIASVNYFGCIDLLDGLLPALERGTEPAAIAMCSNSAQMLPFDDDPFVHALLDHDEPQARRLIEEAGNPTLAYMGSKNAVGKAVRRRAGRWGQAGVRLNAIAPGPVNTPLLQGGLDKPDTGAAIRGLDIPLGRRGEPREIAELTAFLLGPHASWIQGSIYYIDGGNDAVIRPDRY